MFFGSLNEVELLFALGVLEFLLGSGAVSVRRRLKMLDVYGIAIVFFARKGGFIAVDLFRLVFDGIGVLRLEALVLLRAIRLY